MYLLALPIANVDYSVNICLSFILYYKKCFIRKYKILGFFFVSTSAYIGLHIRKIIYLQSEAELLRHASLN